MKRSLLILGFLGVLVNLQASGFKGTALGNFCWLDPRTAVWQEFEVGCITLGDMTWPESVAFNQRQKPRWNCLDIKLEFAPEQDNVRSMLALPDAVQESLEPAQASARATEKGARETMAAAQVPEPASTALGCLAAAVFWISRKTKRVR